MTMRVEPMAGGEVTRLAPPDEHSGLGALATERGNLPLDAIDVAARVTGLSVETRLTQRFRNPYDVPLEATYVFPLPDRAAVTGMRMEAAGRVVEGVLKERQEAREAYDQAIQAGQRASIAEQERPDVFTMRVGNILPGEQVTVRLTLAGAVPYEDGAATYRFPLVVAPRYIPGVPIEGSVGDGVESDTDAVPDASRITPPVLLPGFPNPVRLSIAVELDPAGLPVGHLRSSLHAVDVSEVDGVLRIAVAPGERANRDFVLRWALGGSGDGVAQSLVVVPDADEAAGGTFQLTLLPPALAEPSRPRDVVLVLDRSGSMHGWKMVAARRAAARIVDTLGSGDRFAVLAFDNTTERPPELGEGLVGASDRHRFRAVEFLARTDARGGTEMLAPLREALGLLTGTGSDPRDSVLVLVTDGQVGNEDQILRDLGSPLERVRVHTVGIDQAVNAGFLGRLAALGGGRCELVESEDRLDEAMDRIHRRIATPLVTGLRILSDGLDVGTDSVSPRRLPDLFPEAPVRISGRYSGRHAAPVTVTGRRADGAPWRVRVAPVTSHNTALHAVWARSLLRDLEDRYAAGGPDVDRDSVERSIVDISLRYGVLCRFTAFVAVDSRVATDGAAPHRVVQPVEAPAGWQLTAAAAPMAYGAAAAGGGMMRTAMAPLSPAPGGARVRARGRGVAGVGGDYDEEHGGEYDVRAEAGRERRLLVEAAGGSALERWQALADLASRLRGSTRYLTQLGVAVPERDPLVRLAEALAVCDGPLPDDPEVLERLWRQAVEVLDAVAAGRPAAKDGAAKDGGGRRTAFWKS